MTHIRLKQIIGKEGRRLVSVCQLLIGLRLNGSLVDCKKGFMCTKCVEKSAYVTREKSVVSLEDPVMIFERNITRSIHARTNCSKYDLKHAFRI